MKLFCQNCLKEVKVEFRAELFACEDCGERIVSYEKPMEKELMKMSEIQINRIENLKLSVEHYQHSQAVKRMLELTSFLRRCFALDLFRYNPRLRDEGLRLLDGDEIEKGGEQ